MLDPALVALIDENLRNAIELKKFCLPPEPPPSGDTIYVTTAAELQHALDTVTGPAEIVVARAEYVGNFVLRRRDDTERVTVRADLPSRSRAIVASAAPWIDPIEAANTFPCLTPSDPGLPIVRCEDGAHDYRLAQLVIGPNLARPDMTLLELGSGEATTLDQVPTRLEVDACYIHGDPSVGCRRGVSLQSSHTTIRRCYISDCWYRGQDAQAIASWNSPGEVTIEDNFLSGSGENVIIGGADPKIPDLVPTGITIRNNHIYKPVEWRQYGGSVKNSLELKSAKNVLIEHNVIENCWVDGQPGHAVVFTVRNQDGGAPQSTIKDVMFRWNVVAHVEGCFFNLLGIDNNHPSVRASGLTLAHSLCVAGGGGVQSLSGFDHTTIAHLTIHGPQWKWLSLGGEPMAANTFRFIDSVCPPTEYGITGDDCGIGVPSLDRYAPGAEVKCNAIGQCTNTWVPYPDGNFLVPEGSPPESYFNHTGTDGTPVGVDLAELQRRIPWYTLPLGKLRCL